MRKHDPDEIINAIAYIRAENNMLWMALLRLALLRAPKEARKIIKKITKNDKEVSKWTAKL